MSESALSTRINAVRNAIGDSGTEQRLIKTLPRKGIRFIGEVREELGSCAKPASSLEPRYIESVEVQQSAEGLPVGEPIEERRQDLSRIMFAPLQSRQVFAPRSAVSAVVAIGALCFGILIWSYFAHSAQSGRTRTNIETAAKLTQISETIRVTSREDYEAARAPAMGG